MSESESASLYDLDEYIAACYEDKMELKIISTRKILLLTLDMKNIDFILKHDTLINALSRLLKEEYKKSMDLCIYLLCNFYIFSNYSQFHTILTENEIGGAIMNIIEFQINRFDLLYKQFQEKEKEYNIALKSGKDLKNEFDKELKKFNKIIFKQDKFFYIAFTILLNMAEDVRIEKRMAKKGIVLLLMRMIERNDFQLLIIVLLFLKKLSLIAENKNQMLQEKIVEKSHRFFNSNNNILLQLSLDLLKNLCFEKACREAIEGSGMLPKIIDLLKIPNFRFTAIMLLYLVTIDEKIRFTCAYSDCLSLIIKLIIHFPEPIVGDELVSLAINLAANKRNSEMVTEEEFHKVLDRALENKDVYLLKFIKNISINGNTPTIQDGLTIVIPDLIKLLFTQSKNDELKIEIIGILANIRIGNEWEEFLNNSFLEFIQANLLSSAVEEDIIMETILLVANIANDKACGEILFKSKIFKRIITILIEKSEEDDDFEFVLQILFCIYRFLINKIGIELLLQQETVINFLLKLINVKNKEIKKMNDEILDILREFEPNLSERIKENKFYFYNKEWIETIENYEKNVMSLVNHNEYDWNENYEMSDLNHLDPRIWDDED